MESSVFIRAVLLLFLFGRRVGGELTVPGFDYKVYAREGDINIGYLIHVYRYSSSDFCSDSFRPTGAQNTEIAGFMTDRINADDALLPNISLGFVVFDDCQKDLTALADSVYFVGSGGPSPQSPDSKHRPVAGVVGPIYSRQSVMVSSFLGLFDVPVLSPLSTSDELSDKSRFPYFMRLVPPDSFQAVAIVDVIEFFGWSYVSLLYSEGSFGENAAKHVERLTRSHGVCLAVSKRLAADYDQAEIDRIVLGIRANQHAPVVIFFLETNDIARLFRSVMKYNLTTHFLWISGDSLPSVEGLDVEEAVVGALYLTHPNGVVPGFQEYMKGLSWKGSPNPWRPLIFEDFYHCSWKSPVSGGQQRSCAIYDTLEEAINVTWTVPALFADGFLVYAKALHSLIADNCPHLFLKGDTPRNFSACVTGQRLIRYMKNVSLDGYSDHITFDSKGDMHGKLLIRQLRGSIREGFYHRTVGEWDRTTASLFLNLTELDWGPTKNMARMMTESICSSPCRIGQYYQKKEVPCCWECITCRNNEITVGNRTDCEPCPNFTWPDNKTRTNCEPIMPHYMKSTDVIGISLLAVEILGVLMSAGIIVVYIIKHNSRLIKATNRELSILIITGCMLASFVAVFFTTFPDDVSCLIRQSGFHFVVCILYSPLLAKTTRVYRIFTAGKKGICRPRFISNQAQFVFTFVMILIQVSRTSAGSRVQLHQSCEVPQKAHLNSHPFWFVFQVLLLVLLENLYPTISIRLMPFPYEPYVEITCSLNLESFIPPLSYNLVLIFVCAIFGFLTKSLPENFNDSRYIFVSISTTLFMWSVFLPTYFTTLRSDHKAALLSICLLLNSYITMLCQFFPKVYAVFYVNEESLTFNVAATSTVVRVQPSTVSDGIM
ncbi:hypothetical protein LSH36_1480g00012 [Paralvinella palmiformis]|uniref:G-protein coupled receptors family 3 profile domain-containing protein n=1 Tax=Paralvinella palmiformis TaxID=53620 RepID=A0AAD9MR91_9ANNE|nr:hypothetical protein LSH36_1480g00012 [Paralvinella palmiformis]